MNLSTKRAKGVVQRAGYTDVDHRFTVQRGNIKIFCFGAKKDLQPVRIRIKFDTITELSPNGHMYEREPGGQWEFKYFLNLKGES